MANVDHILNTSGTKENEPQLWRSLADSLPCSLLVIAPDDTILIANARAHALFGATDKNLPGKPVKSVIGRLHCAETSPLDITVLVAEVRSSGKQMAIEGCRIRDGERKIDANITVVPTESGSDLVTISINERSSSTDKSTVRDTALSMVSHELRTPLLHIKGFVSSLLESDIEWDEETKLDFLRTIDREADRLTSMISDLSRIARMGSAEVPVHLEPIDPRRLAFVALDEGSPFVHRHRVVVNIPEGLREIQVDALRLMGVLVNLIENAAKYSAEGSLIEIDASDNGQELVYSVKDHGIGISEQIRGRIFEMFYRAEAVGGSSKGSGLGLAVCKAVVDAHGGDIWVESDGGGSTFSFSVPFATEKNELTFRKTVQPFAGEKRTSKRVTHVPQ